MSYFADNTTHEEDRSESVSPFRLEKLSPTMENWDNDNAGTYNPMEHAERKIVLRCLIRASKAEKKKFKKMERLRMMKLLECELPFINSLKDLTLKDDSMWEQISHISKLTIHDRQASVETILQEFMRMKIYYS